MSVRLFKSFFIWWFSTFLLLLIAALVFMRIEGLSWTECWTFFPNFVESLLTSPSSLAVMTLPYWLFRLIRFLYQAYRDAGWLALGKRSAYFVALPVLFFYATYQITQHYLHGEEFVFAWDDSVINTQDTTLQRFAVDQKQRGMHFFGGRYMDSLALTPLLKNNVEWLTIVPFGSQKDYDSPSIDRRQGSYGTWTARDTAFVNRLKLMRSRGFHLMMKPHVWIFNPSSGKWRSDLMPAGGADAWKVWADSYRAFMLHYAHLGELAGAELFCVGTELHQTVKVHPDFWQQLIRDIRQVFSGQLTYAANWNEEVDDVSFWNELDFIGIQAYYPLVKNTNPSVNELQKGWQTHFRRLKKLHRKFDKPILFTELGYKSTANAAIEPWQWVNELSALYLKSSYETQANCYEAFFRTFWNEPWFAGVHFWQWHGDRDDRDPQRNLRFTPRGKPAENIMAKWFAEITK